MQQMWALRGPPQPAQCWYSSAHEDSRVLRVHRSLAAALHTAREGTGEVRHILLSATFRPRLPGAGPCAAQHKLL